MTQIKECITTLANGMQIFWTSRGEPTELTPVVMLHGLNDSSITWDNAAAELAKDRWVLTPDLPGHGFSDRPDVAYELDWYAEIMSEWAATLNLRQFDIVGHSYGGGVAQVMLLKCRDRIRKMVLVSSGGLGREVNIALRLASLPLILDRVSQPFMKLTSQFILMMVRDGRSWKDIAILGRHNGRQGSARAYFRTLRNVIDWKGQTKSYQERLDQIQNPPPILLLWGTSDNIVPVAHARQLTEVLEQAKAVYFEGCGHYPHYQKPALFRKELTAFLNANA